MRTFVLLEAKKTCAILLSYPVGYLDQALEEMAKVFPLEVGMPCGHVAQWQDVSEVSRQDQPCPCGDPGHWLVKHEVREAVARA